MNKSTLFFPLWFFVLLLTGGIVAAVFGFLQLSNAQDGAIAWGWTFYYLNIFLILLTIIGIIGTWLGAFRSVLVVSLICIVGLGGAIPLSVVLFLGLSMYVLGRLILRNANIHATESLIAGMVLSAFCLSLLAHFPVNNPGTWGLFFTLPLLFGKKILCEINAKKWSYAPDTAQLYLLQCSIGAISLVHVFVGLMPEIGHDALAMHLFIPAYVLQNQKWSFDAATYCWAVMPMSVDWLYTAGYFFAGEVGARFINIGGIFLLSGLVYRVTVWAGASKQGACWSALLFLATPLTFLESSSLYVDGIWSLFLVAGIFSLLRLFSKSPVPELELILSSIFLAGALAAKAATFTNLPILAIVGLLCLRKSFNTQFLKTLALASIIFLAVGALPYLRAFIITGNPVFPFYNALFKSDLYQHINFENPLYTSGFSWDFLYKITFQSGRVLEGSAGSPGFQWILLILPSIILISFLGNYRCILISCIAILCVWISFYLTSYLRYIFPTMALASSIIGVAFSSLKVYSRKYYHIFLIFLLSCLVLNLLHMKAATWYGDIDFSVITDQIAREKYLTQVRPLRKAVQIINEINLNNKPVAIFAPPYTAGLKADAIYSNWYNPRFNGLVQNINSKQELAGLLFDYDISYIVWDGQNRDHKLESLVNGISKLVFEINGVSIRKINEELLFQNNLIPANGFSGNWHVDSVVTLLPDQSVKVTVTSPASFAVPIKPGKKYRYIAEASSAELAAKGRLQVNWLNSVGNIVHVDIQVFDSTAQFTEYTMDVTSPADATTAVVYASGHEEKPVIFKKVLFLK
jgi:hypothetical protein